VLLLQQLLLLSLSLEDDEHDEGLGERVRFLLALVFDVDDAIINRYDND